MTPRTGAALVAYAVLIGSSATPLYEPLAAGRDDSWAVLVVLVGAHFGVGVMVGRAWVLLLPVALSVAGFFIAGAEGLAWLVLTVEGPLLIAATALGWLLGRSLKRRRRLPVAVAAFALAALPGTWTGVEIAKRGPHVSAAVQAQLPVKARLVGLCPRSEVPGELGKLHRSAGLLIELVRRRPNDLVTYSYSSEDGTDVRRDITVKELAEEQLKGFELSANACVPEVKRQIRTAL